MATANPLREDQERNFELELSDVREKIKTKFVELIDCFKFREKELLTQLDNILASYLSYRSDLKKVSERKRGLENMQTALIGVETTSPMKSMHENMLLQINTEQISIEIPIEPKMVSFECDSNKMLAELNKLGRLVEKVRIVIDYKSKKQPLVSVCERGKGIGKLDFPRDVTVDNKTGNILISDRNDHCVKVFDSTGKCLYKFGDNGGEGKMYLPLSLAIYGDRILISQSSHCILNYQLNGRFLSKIGKHGKTQMKFNLPTSLTIDDSNGNIYISDCNNHRIQVLSQNFCFVSQFGEDTLKYPLDVKLSREHIYVLDESNPCLHLFNYNYILQKSVISRGKGMEVVDPFYFFIDQTDTILISDYSSNSIRIFNTEFPLIHKISVSPNPLGITVDNRGRVIVVCAAKNNCLQIY